LLTPLKQLLDSIKVDQDKNGKFLKLSEKRRERIKSMDVIR
jgi:hypothetical protein